MEPLASSVRASDGQPIAVRWFDASKTARRGVTVVVAPGTAIPQRFYGSFAAYLAENGFDTITFDFRTVGESKVADLRTTDSTYVHWGTLDFPAVIDMCRERFSGQPIYVVGHSAGAWLLAIHPRHRAIAGLLAISSMSGYWGDIGRPDRYKQWLTWTALIPVVTRLWGYVPGSFGLGQDMPSSHMRQWARWCLDPQFMFADPEVRALDVSAEYRGRLGVVLVEDDNWARPRAVRAVYDRFVRAETSTLEVGRANTAGQAIGHFGFFRPKFRDSLWPVALEWLIQASRDAGDSPARASDAI
jgi:predicted alpha/beta hydrolase